MSPMEMQRWVGWYRPRRPGARWRAVAAGNTEAEALALLLRHEALDAHAELLVLPDGRTPQDRTATVARTKGEPA
jgi:hypothetical protein